jgi:protein TonB
VVKAVKVQVDNSFHAPTKIPKIIDMSPKEEAPPPSSAMGTMGGVMGGVPGGVFGGVAGGVGSGGPVVTLAKPKGPLRISSGVVAGLKLSTPSPIYPPIAKVAHMSGVVVLHAVISKTGSIESLSVQSTTNAMFNNSALDAVKQWKYKPYVLNGDPTEVDTTITVNFNLNSGG